MSTIILGIVLALVLIVAGNRFSQFIPGKPWYYGVGLILVCLLWSTVVMVPAGHVGVQTLFGKVFPETLGEGIHFINPLISVYDMSVRTREVFEHAEVPSKEGLNVVLEASMLYHVEPDKAARLYQQVGPRFDQVVLTPQFRSAIRGVTVQHEAKDLYTSGRELIASQITQDLEKPLKERGLVLEKVLLRRITLPKMVEEAINDKLAAEQQAQQMQFVLAKETQEAERKRIEAKGIQDFQNIVSQGISDPLLRWKGIEATKMLAESKNTKVIIVGGKDGLPLILNTETRGR
ncbi:MAG: prohibitin family protein [Thermodesulfobacteriota bacterium]